MTTIAVVADTHADQGSRFEEHNRIMAWIAEDAAARGVSLVAHAGDCWERRSTSAERAAVGEWVAAVTEFAPLVVVAGNHDDPLDVAWLGRLRTRHPVRAFDSAGVVAVAGCAVACLPWPRKAHLMAARGVSGEAAGEAAADALRAVLLGLGQQLDAHGADVPRLLLAHAMVDGARTDHDQPLVGADMAVSVADLALARASFVALGHVHAQNEWLWEGVPVAYAGAPRHNNFGEPGPKGYLVVTFDGPRLVRWERIPTPATPMLLITGTWSLIPDGNGGYWAMDLDHDLRQIPAGAECRLRYQVDPDQRDAARHGAEERRRQLLEAGAAAVRVEEQVLATSTARAPEVAAARTLEEKLAALWRVRGFDPGARRPALIEKLGELEREAQHAA